MFLYIHQTTLRALPHRPRITFELLFEKTPLFKGDNVIENSLQHLNTLGQSVWLDYIRSDLIASGDLKQMIEEDGLSGITSNPAIFEKAIAESSLYDQTISEMAHNKKGSTEIYDALSQRDVQNAADAFRAVYEQTSGKDGYVSLEVNPHLAHDSKGTIEEAHRLWKVLDRPNVFIKVPATSQGLLAIQDLIREGINVNVTLLFGLPRYRQVAEAYIMGLEARVADGKSIRQIASVASFFLSRIDTMVDPLLMKETAIEGINSEVAKKIHGQVAISSAKAAYEIYTEIFDSDRFAKLAAQGARPQRLLWASTGNKNPEYSDIKYIEKIIGPNTVNTIPPETLKAYRDHGDPQIRIKQDLDGAHHVLSMLTELGINLDSITQKLEEEGIEKFIVPFDKLMDSITTKSAQ